MNYKIINYIKEVYGKNELSYKSLQKRLDYGYIKCINFINLLLENKYIKIEKGKYKFICSLSTIVCFVSKLSDKDIEI